ncbi:MAG: DUF1593 domain-containing protein [Pirellulaceae bacterium]|nr:DUF1593 domain-containing protein [Pirellulaceae bacterium]
MLRLQLLLVIGSLFAETNLIAADAEAPAKLRVIIETDAGGDPDDEQSLVRFLLYTSEWDVEGILCTRPQTKQDENNNKELTGLGIVRRQLKAYAAVYDKLKQHGPFPPPDALWERTIAGYDDHDDGVKLIMDALDRDDPRPIWFSNWGTNDGTTSSLKRAMDKILKERGPEAYAKLKAKVRLCSDDMFGDHTTKLSPPWKMWVYTKYPDMDGGRWYHRFGPLTAKAGGFDLQRDVLTGHGPLGETYPTNTHLKQKEGDTPEFLYLVPNGLNEPEQPTWGSWAGRFGKQKDVGDRQYYWPSVRDTIDGKAHRDHTLQPWVAHIQNDFKARMDWCVLDLDEANHPPAARLVGDLRRTVKSGDTVELDGTPSTDPDKDKLRFEWRYYAEPGTYRGEAPKLDPSREGKVSFVAPRVETPQTLHVILIVTDAGEPRLTRYARSVITVQPRGE